MIHRALFRGQNTFRHPKHRLRNLLKSVIAAPAYALALPVAFSRGISNVYNETPIRQGRKFWHYGKSFDQVKAANATYLDRSECQSVQVLPPAPNSN